MQMFAHAHEFIYYVRMDATTIVTVHLEIFTVICILRVKKIAKKLDTQNFRYSKFLVTYKFIQLIQLHVSIAAGR